MIAKSLDGEKKYKKHYSSQVLGPLLLYSVRSDSAAVEVDGNRLRPQRAVNSSFLYLWNVPRFPTTKRKRTKKPHRFL